MSYGDYLQSGLADYVLEELTALLRREDEQGSKPTAPKRATFTRRR